MARRRGSCVFCQTHGDLTREDPVSGWIAEVLRDAFPGTRGVRAVSRMVDANGVVAERERIVGAADAYKPRIVCQPCNTRWMSQIERTAKPILEPMIRGTRTGLSLRDQEAVAIWLALKVLTFDLLNPSVKTVSAVDLTTFYRDRRPPQAFAAWLARYQPDDPTDMVLHHSAPISTGEDIPGLPMNSPHSLRFTLIIGSLAMQTQFETEQARAYPGGVYWDDPHPQLVRIWPRHASEVNWPPPLSVTPDGLPIFTGQALAGVQVGRTSAAG